MEYSHYITHIKNNFVIIYTTKVSVQKIENKNNHQWLSE